MEVSLLIVAGLAPSSYLKTLYLDIFLDVIANKFKSPKKGIRCFE
jgi:hypothetical protein|tara:strand:+ start:746 stop:880 length:135 start_codon:yes stop_codon:yes gene_type:complete